MNTYTESVEPGEWVFGLSGYAGRRWVSMSIDLLKVSIQLSYTRKSYRRKTK